MRDLATAPRVPAMVEPGAFEVGQDLAVTPGAVVYRTEMFALLRCINTYLVRWARRKFKRLRAFKRAKSWWNGLMKREPALFAHWVWMPEF